jgi:hypothetical protein
VNPSFRPHPLAIAGALLSAVAFTAPVQAGHLNIVLEAALDGRQEVGADRRVAGDPNGRGEAYVFGIDGNTTTLCYVLQVARIGELSLPPGNGRQAHIHRGAFGVNGPVVVTIAWPQDGRAADCIAEDRILPNGNPAFSRDPDTGEPLATVFEILMNPEQFYINVHNAEYPAGAVRGQLQDTLQP